MKIVALSSTFRRQIAGLNQLLGLKETKMIGADGPQSLVRKQASMDCLSWKYDQWGVVATLNLGEITENIVAWQKFLPTGPIALLPLTENLSSLVWSTTPEHAKNLISMEEDRFIDAINNAFWEDFDRHPLVDRATRLSYLLASFIQPWTNVGSGTQSPPSVSGVEEGSRAMFPYGFGHATEYVRPRLALIGPQASDPLKKWDLTEPFMVVLPA